MKNQTTRKKTVKATALILAAMISVPAISLAKDPEKVNAAFSKNMNNTHLGSATISSPAAPETKDKRWNGDYVFFGSYNGSPIKFRVLDPKTDKFGMKTMFLDSDRVLFDYPFDPSTNEWADSNLRKYLNQGFQSLNFSRPEAKAIPVVSLKQESYETGSWMEYIYGKTVPLSNDKIFLLDAADVTNPAYGYSSNPGYTYDAEQDWWKGTSVYNRAKGDLDNGYSWYWLRNKRTNSDNVVYAGAISMMDAGREATLGSMDVTFQMGVAPALNVDLNSVIFNTQTLTPDQSGLGAQYKLTIIDDNVSIGLTSGSEISVSGSKISVPYTIKGNNAGSVNQVSVLITDMPWSKGNAYNANILYYGALSGDVSSSGTGTFKLPSGYDINKWGIDYHVYILAEELATGSNAVYLTDYASEPTYLYYCPNVIDIDLYKGPTMISGAAADAMLEFTLSDIADRREDDTYIYYDLDADGSEDLVFDIESGFISALENNKTLFAYTGEEISDSNISALILRFREPQNVTISFDGQGASGSMESVSVKEGSIYTVPENTGFTGPFESDFYSWKLDGEIVKANEKLLVTKDITLNAYWIHQGSQLCKITFMSDQNGTETFVDYCLPESEYTLPDCMFRGPDGSGFAGWSAGNPGDKITVKTDKIIYAQWIQLERKPGTVTGLKAEPAGKNKVKLTWNAVGDAEGYLVYAQKDKKYGYVGMTTKGTTFTDTKALDTDYNFYWVFAYVKSDGKMIPGACQKYVYAKGVCVAVTGLKASSVKGGVKLTWNAVNDAEGYLVYGIHPGGQYGYIGMTTKGTTFTDTKASSADWNFYWVFPYHKNGNTMVVGGTPKYVYGKAK